MCGSSAQDVTDLNKLSRSELTHSYQMPHLLSHISVPLNAITPQESMTRPPKRREFNTAFIFTQISHISNELLISVTILLHQTNVLARNIPDIGLS
jgi:hypothetical protein